MPYQDLRQYMEQLDQIGELTRLDGVHWDEEVGAVYHISSDAVLMDNFPGYPPGYRILVNLVERSLRRSDLLQLCEPKTLIVVRLVRRRP